jgi:mitogen-activated protein kinase 1/3
VGLLVIQHDPDDEPIAPPLDPEFFEFDCKLFVLETSIVYSSHPAVHKDDISREQLKELLYEEIMSFHPAPIT